MLIELYSLFTLSVSILISYRYDSIEVRFALRRLRCAQWNTTRMDRLRNRLQEVRERYNSLNEEYIQFISSAHFNKSEYRKKQHKLYYLRIRIQNIEDRIKEREFVEVQAAAAAATATATATATENVD